MTYSVTIEMTDAVVSVPTGNTGNIVQVDLRKIPAAVMAELLRQGVIKPLTDVSKGDDTDAQWHERRRAKVQNWYNGDFSVRGGGVADPVGVQMKEEIIATYLRNGMTRKAAEKTVKGTAVQFLTAYYSGDKAKVEKAIAHYRAKAEATLANRRKAAEKIDLSKIDLLA